MSTTQPTTNYFILLDINPDAPWNEADFEKRVREKRNQWTRKANGVGKSALIARQSLAQLKGYEMLKKPLEREKQAQAARIERASAQGEARSRLQKRLDFITPKGYIEPDEFATLIKDYPMLSEQDIRGMLSVPVKTSPSPATSTTSAIQPLEPSTFKKINESLSILNMSTLYEVLGLDRTISNEHLLQAAEKLYNDMAKRQPSSEVDAKKDLAGQARVIFKTAEMRRSYDESVHLSTLEEILKHLSESISHNMLKEVTPEQEQVFLEQARKAGWNEEVAREKLIERARKRGWFIHMPASKPQPQATKLLRCGRCKHMNEPNRKFCQSCNLELLTSCPSCGTTVQADGIYCGDCGFAIGNHYRVDDLLENFLHTQDLATAQSLLDEAATLWGPAKPDERVQKINAYQARLDKQRQEQQAFQQQLEKLIEDRQLFAAKRYLDSNHNQIAEAKSNQKRIDDGITQARNLLNTAQSTRDREEKANLYRMALRMCSDYAEARKLLSEMPPTPAAALQSRVNGTLVILTWNESPTQGVRYQIVCKAHKQPISPGDGTLLATVSATTYNDTRAEIGVPLYYAIFTECEGISASQPALLSTPIFLLQDIQDELIEVGNQHIILKWSAPTNVQTIIVIRKENLAPRTIDDGQRLMLSENSRLIDTNVLNGRTYYYKIFSQFSNQGQTLTSAGKVIQARPEAPPAVIMELDISNERQAQGYRVQLKWKAPSKGKVVILKSKRSTKMAAGEIISIEQLQHHGNILEGQGDSLSDEWSNQGIYYYTPVVSFGGMAYIGAEVHYACIDEVKNLRAENLGSALRLQWDWPPTCQEVTLAYTYDGWHGKMVFSRTITRAEYTNFGYFDIRGEEQQDYFIRITNTIRQDQQIISSAGAQIQARLANKLELSYEIKKALLGNKRTLHIYAPTPGTVPSLSLVVRRDRLPAKKTDGERLWRIQGPIHIKKGLSFPLPDRKYEAYTFCKLYAEEDSAYDNLKIQHPSDSKLRLD
ncbi:hypothetical protein KDW_04170 [Dictyobacter vulcani]|uniref:DZANK-type domain-containing protein n=1 Tax=Dictyobacter vulcani TaxID=2607529 RepID=A0A5J4KFU1_9CHLR|nr:zinc ribbon domain-containing protein [Dictyobacter vulcani]GER86255.1 hypothetical protein KDW_04170 [Dictyobacter vulcani]